MKYVDELKTTTMLEFYEKTASTFTILACRAGSDNCNENWTTRLYQEGACKPKFNKIPFIFRIF